MITIFRVLGIYLGLIEPDTGDLCVSCQYALAPRGGGFCADCDRVFYADEPCFFCGKSGCKCENTVPEHFFG